MFRSAVLRTALMLSGLMVIHSPAQTASPASTGTAQTATLTVSITGLRNDKGQVFIELWNGPDGFPMKDKKGYKTVAVDASKAVDGTVTTTFDVPPGTYAVTTLHDENRNGKMDTNAIGIPKEGYGASDNVVSRFHIATFEKSKFQVTASGQKVCVKIHY